MRKSPRPRGRPNLPLIESSPGKAAPRQPPRRSRRGRTPNEFEGPDPSAAVDESRGWHSPTRSTPDGPYLGARGTRSGRREDRSFPCLHLDARLHSRRRRQGSYSISRISRPSSDWTPKALLIPSEDFEVVGMVEGESWRSNGFLYVMTLPSTSFPSLVHEILSLGTRRGGPLCPKTLRLSQSWSGPQCPITITTTCIPAYRSYGTLRR